MKRLTKRVLSLFLVVALLMGLAVPGMAAETVNTQELLSFREVEGHGRPANLLEVAGEPETRVTYADTDRIRVSIVLSEKSTLDKGFSTMNIAENAQAMAYRQSLQEQQEVMTAQISKVIGEELQVVWNLTLAANIISADVRYGELDAIRSMPGVQDVVIEARYAPCVVADELPVNPMMSTSGEMIGTTATWASGYTGAGSRIAVIDSGVDPDHQAFDGEAYFYALEQQAIKAGMDTEEYIDSLSLLTVEEIASRKEQLHIQANADRLYRSGKIPFAYNYADTSLDVSHLNDSQTEHGSHVAGIATANSYLNNGDGTFTDIMDDVKVQGVAPNAQLMVMKVFGATRGGYESDYMVAIEDALILGADAINLSLGSVYAGYSRNDTYARILDSLVESDTVVSISASNAGAWPDQALHGVPGYLFADDVNMSTAGAPGTYTNAFTVASVDNIGLTDYFLHVGDELFTYAETDYDNAPIMTLVGEHDYIVLPGFGTEAEFEALGDVVEGKVVFVHRGENSFFEKGNAAVAHGAIATIVINNTTGIINMDLTDYEYTAPFVSVTQADGQWITDNSQVVTDNDGNELYRTGKMEITGTLDTTVFENEYYSMSYFSSWGVPSSLEMKPEITAPGGNIYSVNGKHAVDGGYLGGSDQYENMSGTSMAAPQVAGMAALMAQYIRENKLDEKTGLTVRALSQSLLMSTAVPMKQDADSYYPVLRQGSGLANVNAAVNAQSYVMMNANATESWADGKIKAELGDDPARNGQYSFGFTLNNMSDEAQQFILSGELFTQGLAQDEDGVFYMDTETVRLLASLSWTVDGQEMTPARNLSGMDFNGDGFIDTADVQTILDQVIGTRETLNNAENADLNGDGVITTYDAYELLKQLSTGIVSLPAGGQATVQVTAQLTDGQMAELDAGYPNGAYIQGYFFADEFSSEEGVEGTTHSIPMLAFYGNWSDPSMFDKTTFVDSYYGDDSITYLGNDRINVLAIKYPGDPTGYYFVGNPYFVEDEYPAERAAISTGSTLYQYQMSLIRNAGAVMAVVTDDAGDILYTGPVMDQVNAAFYYTSYQAWSDTAIAYPMNKKVSTLKVEEGDRINITLVAVPSYYESNGALTAEEIKQLMDEDALGHGAYLRTSMVIDDTAPQIYGIAKDFVTGNLTVTAQDNQYISMVSIQDRSGNEYAEAMLPQQTDANEMTSVTFDLTDVKIGEKCYIVVADYADNQTVYEVEYGGEPEDYSGKFYAFTSSTYRGAGQRWIEIEPEVLYYRNSTDNEGIKTAAFIDLEITAADYVDGYVYMAADDGYLYVAKQGLWDEYEPAGYFGGIFDKVYDMAYNYADGKLYCMGDDSTVYSVGLIDGEFTKEFTVTIDHPSSSSSYKWLSRLAIDNNGTFYSVNNGPKSYTYLYKWTSADIVDGAVSMVPSVGRVYFENYDYPGALAWDHEDDILYFANAYSSASGGSGSFLVKVDTETGEGTKVNTTYAGENAPGTYASRMQCSSAGLYIVPNQTSGIAPVTEATKITLDITETEMLKGQTITLRPTVYPWTLEDKSVTWESSDESVVKVVDGEVTGVGVGTATVTATTVASPNLKATCTITVEQLPTIKLNGLAYDKDGKAYWAEFTTDDATDWTAVSDETGAYLGGGILEETMYVHDGKELFTVDADDFTTTSYGAIAPSYIWSDSTFAPYTEEGLFGDFMALANNGTFLETVVAEIGEVDYWDLTSYFAEDPMAVIAYHKSDVSDYSTILPSYVKYFDCPTQYYYMITESGLLHEISVLTYDQGYSYVLNYEVVGQIDLDLSGVSAVTDGRSASMVYDEATGWLVISACMGGENNKLYAVNPQTFVVVDLGNFGENGEAMVALYQHDRAADLTVRLNKYEDSVYTGETLQLVARVKPNAYAQDVVWSSSDTSIATVDDNGLVTAIKDGNVTITATSVATNDAGLTASASCEITVLAPYDLDTQVHAQIVTDEGTQWVTINTKDMSVKVNANAKTTLTGAGMHDGKFYGTDSDLKSSGTIYQVDPANGYAETAGIQCPTGYAFLDVTQAPEMEYVQAGTTKYAFDFPIYLANDQGFYFLRNFQESDFFGYGDSSYSDQGAMAYVGQIYEKSYGTQHLFYVLAGHGSIYRIKIGPASYRMRRDVLGKADISFYNFKGMTMDYYNDGTKEGLVVGYNNALTGAVELYYIDLVDDALKGYKLGTVPGATAISGLTMAEEQQYETHAAASELVQGEGIYQSATQSLNVPYVQYVDPIKLSEVETKAEGGLNAVTVEAQPQSEETVTEQVVTIEVTAKNASGQDVMTNNGYTMVAFDAQLLELQEIEVMADFQTIVEEDGMVKFVYADLAGFAAGETTAKLTFKVLEAEDNIVSITHVETVDQIPGYKEDIAVIYGHSNTEIRNAKKATCTEDGYTGDTYCVDCGKLLIEGEIIPAYCPSMEFSDLEMNQWYHQYIDYVLETGLMEGIGDGKFAPNANMTRAQLVTVLYRMAGEPAVELTDVFQDVREDDWFSEAVSWAYANGITQGMTESLFAPHASVTREQMVTFFARYAVLSGVEMEAEGDLSDFTDAAAVSEYAEDAMIWAVENGLILGMDNGTIAPKGTATRAQVAAILMRYCEAFAE